MRKATIALVSVLAIAALMSLATAQSKTGYDIIIVSGDRLSVHPDSFHIPNSAGLESAVAEFIRESGGGQIVRPVAIAPDFSQLAFNVEYHDGRDALLIVDLTADNQVQEYTLSEPTLSMEWSPDGTSLFAQSTILSANGLTIITPSEARQSNVLAPYHFGPKWLPEGNRLLFLSRAVCGEECPVTSDLYISDIQGNVQALTNFNQVELIIPGDNRPLDTASLGIFAYSSLNDRIYIAVSEGSESPLSRELVYSVDLEGEIQFEFDLTPLFSPDEMPIVDNILLNTTEQGVYIVVRTVINKSGRGYDRLSVVELAEASAPRQVTVKEFGPDNRGGVFNVSLSPDGSLLAIVGVNNDQGELTVVNLATGSVVASLTAENYLICEAVWISTTQIVYGQKSDYQCLPVRSQPADLLIEFDLTTQLKTTVAQGENQDFYLVSGKRNYP